MSNRSTVLKIVSLMLVASVLLAACAPAAAPTAEVQTVEKTVIVEKVLTATPAPAEPVDITYYTYTATPNHLQDLDTIIAAFEKENPNIKVKVEATAFADYFTRLQTLVAGGTAPDVMELNYENFVTYSSRGLLLDLAPYLAKTDTFDPAVYYPRALEAFSYNGMQEGLPATFSTSVLYFNKDLFDKAGVAYPTKDWTWSDAMEAAKKLNDPANGVWGIYSPIQFWEFYKKAAQNNCKFFNDDKTAVSIDSPECVQALDTMYSFIKEGVMPTDAQMGGVANEDMFKQGKIAILVSGIWMFSTFKDAPFAWDISVEPGMATHATHFFSDGVAVFAASKHPAEAAAFAKFYTSNTATVDVRLASSWELPAINNPDAFKAYLSQTPPANRQAVFDSLEFAIVPPTIARQSEMQDAITRVLDQVKLGTMTAEDAMKQAKTDIEPLLK
jgi:multiple sugar transport system substrate-binding protein